MPQKPNYKLVSLRTSGSIGKNISHIRKEKGITQEQLAQSIGITQTLVSKYERGRLQISAEMITQFAIALNTSADKVLGLKDFIEEKDISLKISRRMSKIEALPESEQRALLKTIDVYIRGVD